MVWGIETAEEFNDKFPIGTPVEFWDYTDPEHSKAGEYGWTRTKAWTVDDGTPVVAVSARTAGRKRRVVPGGIALSHIRTRAE